MAESVCYLTSEDAFMLLALLQASESEAMHEVPVGAVLAHLNGLPIAQQGNRTRTSADPTGHAEICALRKASRHHGDYRLPRTRLFVTLEPCPMCLEAARHARVEEIHYAALRENAHATIPPVLTRYQPLFHPTARQVARKFFLRLRHTKAFPRAH